MKNTLSQVCYFFGIVAVALFVSGCAEVPTEGAVSWSTGYGSNSASVSSATSPNVASGHYGDTLQACLGRIPSNSTDSQRMLATGTCQRDEGARQSIQSVPGN